MNDIIPNITHKPIIIKTDNNILIPIILFLICGGQRIRTLETPAAFQVRCNRPLCQTSKIGSLNSPNLARLGAYDRIELSSLQPQCSILAIKLISPYIKVFILNSNYYSTYHYNNKYYKSKTPKHLYSIFTIFIFS